MKYLNGLIACSLVMALASCDSKKKATTDTTENRAERVQTETMTKSPIERSIEISSTLQGYETMNIAPSLTGIIQDITVEVGTKVHKGQLLVRMDENQYNNTKLTMANLETEMSRMEALRESGNVSQQTYDQTKLGYDQTKQSLAFLEKNTYVKAQFDGVISAKNFEDGELYGGNPAILVLTKINVLKAYINIPESYFPRVKEGMKLNIASDIYPGKQFPATIEIVHPTIDASTHTFQVKVKINNSTNELRPGMYVHATLPLADDKAIMVPYQAVLKLIGSNERYIFVNKDGVAKRVTVKTGTRNEDKVEIISDEIAEGDEIVVVGQGRLVEGSKLEIVK
ncbi:MAG: efflux RND transporter periplasmic adaptor subunit [Salinivirgaceae bacterium]|nr:efflux RND transporter periplasmic adaptor subunit [Salinivirgaceae bacterium]